MVYNYDIFFFKVSENSLKKKTRNMKIANKMNKFWGSNIQHGD